MQRALVLQVLITFMGNAIRFKMKQNMTEFKIQRTRTLLKFKPFPWLLLQTIPINCPCQSLLVKFFLCYEQHYINNNQLQNEKYDLNENGPHKPLVGSIIRRCGLPGGSVSLGVGLEVSNAQARSIFLFCCLLIQMQSTMTMD